MPFTRRNDEVMTLFVREKEKKMLSLLLASVMLMGMLASCGQGSTVELGDEPVALATEAVVKDSAVTVDANSAELSAEAAALTEAPAALPQVMTAVASGVEEFLRLGQ